MNQGDDKIYGILLEIQKAIGQQIQKTDDIKEELNRAVTDYGERIDQHDIRIVKLEETIIKQKGALDARKPFYMAFWEIAKMLFVFGLGVLSQIIIGRKVG